MEKEIHTLVGIAASGKSTYAERLIRNRLMEDFEVPMPDNYVDPTCYLNADDIRKELYGDPTIQGDGNLIFSILRERLETALRDSTTDLIIVDNTSLKYKIRKRYWELAHAVCPMFDHTFKSYLVYFEPNLERSLKWNQKRERHVPDDVIQGQFDRIQEPTEIEIGRYTEIIRVNNDA